MKTSKRRRSFFRCCSIAVALTTVLVVSEGRLEGESVPRAESEPKPLFLDVGEDSVHYETSGTGCPIVLIGGGSGMDFHQWDAVSDSLSKKHLVVRYDPRGSGLSDNPTEPYSDAADLTALINHLEIPRALLVGLSSSGGFALEYAVTNPDRLLGVVAAGPLILGFEFSESMVERIQRIGRAAQAGRKEFLDAMFDDSHFIPAPNASVVRAPARENMGRNYDKGAGFDVSLAKELDPPLIEQLADIATPVFLLAGELDHPEIHRRNQFLQETLQNAQGNTIPNAGHNVHLEAPLGFITAIELFVGERCASR